ncbi:MAG: VWA domain-containing protein, partial [Candidatus Eremiobacteraeota bacterium]|nr:VWA domain-containing protein [Candidatus Eremiobacteraeota bacterium]
SEQSSAADFLAERRGAVVALARDLVERRLAARGPAEAERLHDRFLREARLANIERRDVERMRVLVRAMARRLATRYGRTRTRARRGELDMSATMRRNVAFDGVPFDIVWKRRKIRKPRLVVLCDVSGSVARLASFMLLFASELAGVVADVRSFAFSDSLIEVTDVLAHRSIEQAGEDIMRSIGFHSSSYGQALADFERSHLASVDRKTTVVILGDARTNYGDPRVDVVRALRDRAKRVVWLNPEPRGSWGTDDSEMLRYLPLCAVARTCNSLRHLEDAIEELVRAAH